MDKKLIQQYGEDILCYRLRSARQKKRMRYEDFAKWLRKLNKEENEIYQQIARLGWQPLNPPVQKGWKRFFVLRDDVTRSKDAEFFEGILKKINTYSYSNRKDFKKKKKKQGKKIYVETIQNLLQPGETHFKKLEFSEAAKQFFHEEYYFDTWRKALAKRYVFNEPWRFVLRTKPNMIDKVRIKDAELESKKERMQNYLERNDLMKKQHKVIHGYYKWRGRDKTEKKIEVSIYKNKSLQQILDAAIKH